MSKLPLEVLEIQETHIALFFICHGCPTLCFLIKILSSGRVNRNSGTPPPWRGILSYSYFVDYYIAFGYQGFGYPARAGATTESHEPSEALVPHADWPYDITNFGS